MDVHVDATRTATPATGAVRRTGFRVTAWVLAVSGAIAAFLGTFILLGGENQYVGLGGDLSWSVDEIDPAWGTGLLVAGAAALLGALALALHDRGVAPARRSGWGDVAAHAAVFLLVNGFLWAQDLALGGGLDYAYWVTIPWGIGLAAHVAATAAAPDSPVESG